jgi:hypothetical protein
VSALIFWLIGVLIDELWYYGKVGLNYGIGKEVFRSSGDEIPFITYMEYFPPWLLLGLICGLWYSGLDVIYHYVLRFILYLKGYTFRDYARFLDYTTKLIFLQKIGGGYIFIHRLLLEHFASMSETKMGEISTVTIGAFAKSKKKRHVIDNKKEHSDIGITSLVVSLFTGTSGFGCLATVFYFQINVLGDIQRASFMYSIFLLLAFIIMITGFLIGLVLAIVGCFQKNRKKIFAILGIIFNIAIPIAIPMLLRFFLSLIVMGTK